MTGYKRLSEGLTQSTLWELPLSARVVFLGLLSMADRDGFVAGADSVLRRILNVSREEWEEAIELLLSPDPDSSSTVADGRRLERREMDGRRGLYLVTFGGWDARWSSEAKREADARRKAERRELMAASEPVRACPSVSAAVRECPQPSEPVRERPSLSEPVRSRPNLSEKVAPNLTYPNQTQPNPYIEGAPAPGSLSSEHPAEDSPPQSLARPVTPRPPPPDLADVALRLTAAPHEFPYVAPILAPAIATVWEAWREFARSPNAPCPRTWAGTRPIIERLADGHSPESLATALRNAHPRCWARGRGLAAALSNLDSLARDGASTAGGKPPVGQTQTEGSRWRGQQATIRSMVHSRLCVVLPGYEDMSDEERRLLWEPLSDRLQAEGWDGEGQMPPTPEIDRWVDDAHRKGAA